MKKTFAAVILSVAVIFLFGALKTDKSVLAPSITIPTVDGTYVEGVGLCFDVRISDPLNTSTTVDIVVDPATTATLSTDFTYSPQTVEFPAGFSGSMPVCVITINDQIPEDIELIRLKLANPSNDAMLLDSEITFTLYDNDSITTTNPCKELFISEYIQANVPQPSAAIEIFNPGEIPAVLENYSLRLYFNGSTEANILPLEGLLLPGETYVVANENSHPDVLAVADRTVQVSFTGDDAIGLYKNGTLLDVIGVIGEDPGLYWPAGASGATSSRTLVRDSIIRQGEISWPISAAHWKVYNQGDFTHLGSHFMLPCDPSGNIPPLVSVVTANAAFPEDIGGLGISVAQFYPNQQETTVEVKVMASSTATAGQDFILDQNTITFPAGFTGNMSFGLSIVDDMLDEPDETVVIQLANPTNNAILLDSTWVLTIQDNDLPVGLSGAEPERFTINLAPNPAKGSAHIILSEEADRITVANLEGRVMLDIPAPVKGDNWIDLRNLPAGVYLVTVHKGDQRFTRRLIRQE